MEILGKLGIDYRLLIAQAINFLIVLAILSRYLYSPILRAIEDRERTRREIESSEKRLAAEKAKFADDVERKRRETSERIRELIEEAASDAEKIRRERVSQALNEADEILRRAESRAEDRQRVFIKRRRSDILNLAEDVTARLIKGEHRREADRALLRDLLKEVRRRDWSAARKALEERPPGRENLGRVASAITERYGPHSLDDRELGLLLTARTSEELSTHLSSMLERPIKASSTDLEEIKRAASPTLTITSAFPLSTDEVNVLMSSLEAVLGTPLTPMLLVDETLLGGASLEVAGIRLDGTLSGRLKRLVEAKTA